MRADRGARSDRSAFVRAPAAPRGDHDRRRDVASKLLRKHRPFSTESQQYFVELIPSSPRPTGFIQPIVAEHADMDIGLMFTALGLAKSVAEMLKIIDSLEAKVDRLVHSELNAGFRNLEQAGMSAGESSHLLREARNCFNRAVSLETGYRRGIALLGCAACHYHLGDRDNCDRVLAEIVALRPAVGVATLTAAQSKEMAKDLLNPAWLFGAGHLVFMYKQTVKWSKRLTSQQELLLHKKNMVMDAVNGSTEARSLMQLQEGVSGFIGLPVSWLEDLEAGRFSLLA